MPNANGGYASYLVRFQCIQAANDCTWIASTQSTATGELRRFANLDALVQFLQDEFQECLRTKGASQAADHDMPDSWCE